MRANAEKLPGLPRMADGGLSSPGRPADRLLRMSDWKGYGPDNTVPSAAGVAESGLQSAISAGALTYEPHYGLKAKPFSLSTDPRSLYTAPGHAEALDDLLAAIRRREGIVVVTGEMGTGKTTLCRAALYQLDRKTFTTFVPDPFISREDLLRMLLVDFGEVSVEELRKGRLSGATRPDLSYQLYEFLTSLESVDAFAVLVIDEAQHLASPLLEEVRALSELEAGRRLMQIVLVGQPELESHLKQPHLRQIDQRVTMRCEVKPFSREDLTGYVSHRLALAGGAKDRISFSPAALDLVHRASAGIPRVINLVCDRALTRGHLEQLAVISPVLVAKAMEDLRLVSAPVPPVHLFEQASAPVVSPVAVAQPATKPADTQALGASDLNALLNMAPTVRRETAKTDESSSVPFAAVPAWKSRVAAERSRHRTRFRFLRMLLLPLIGMTVMLVAGGIVFKAPRFHWGSARVEAAAPQTLALRPLSPEAAMAAPHFVPDRAITSSAKADTPVRPGASELPETPAPAAVAPASSVAAAAAGSGNTWVVQVAAFANPERSAALVARLSDAGMPAFEVSSTSAQNPLHFVRVGPYRAAAEADDVRARLRQMPELEGAFVRNVASNTPATN